MDMKEKLIEVFMHLDRHIQNRDEYGICYTSDFVEAVENVLEMLKNPNNVGSKWISVGDRLPDAWVDVLSCDRNKNLTVDCVDKKGKWYSEYADLEEVTHWMPLPEPPKGE